MIGDFDLGLLDKQISLICRFINIRQFLQKVEYNIFYF